jgi:hypothetical protein
LLDGPINGERFRTYLERVLVPTLRPGDIVVYSPDLNPIEQIFACPKGMRSIKLKPLLRKATARTVDTVSTAIGHLLDSFTIQECKNYFINSGSQPT